MTTRCWPARCLLASFAWILFKDLDCSYTTIILTSSARFLWVIWYPLVYFAINKGPFLRLTTIQCVSDKKKRLTRSAFQKKDAFGYLLILQLIILRNFVIIRPIPISRSTFVYEKKNWFQLAFLKMRMSKFKGRGESEDVWFIVFGSNCFSCQCREIAFYLEQELII